MGRQVFEPVEVARFSLPSGLGRRLQELLLKQDRGERLNPDELQEAEGLVDLAELLSLLKLRAMTRYDRS